MGADAHLFVFDHSKYSAEIVPAFRSILRDGSVPAWIAEIYRKREMSLNESEHHLHFSGGVDVQAHCTHLDAEFAALGQPYLGSLYESRWSDRTCKRLTCPERTRCPFVHDSTDEPANEAYWLLSLLEMTIAQSCLGPCQFLGRSIDAFWYWDLLDSLGLSASDPVRRLLTLLGRRGYVIGYRWTIGTEGIHGWLSREEAAELAELLFALPLPDYDQTFAAMGSFHGMSNLLADHPWAPPFYAATYEHPTASFEELSLSFVRTVCLLASRDGKGVLWGNDVYVHDI